MLLRFRYRVKSSPAMSPENLCERTTWITSPLTMWSLAFRTAASKASLSVWDSRPEREKGVLVDKGAFQFGDRLGHLLDGLLVGGLRIAAAV